MVVVMQPGATDEQIQRVIDRLGVQVEETDPTNAGHVGHTANESGDIPDGDGRRRHAEMNLAAPEFKDIDEWINTKPLEFKDLRGKVVVLHFWTFG